MRDRPAADERFPERLGGIKASRNRRTDGASGPPQAVTVASLRKLAQSVSGLSIGEYRWVIGEARRQKRAQLRGKPVKALRSRIKRDSRDVRWSKDIRARDAMCRFHGHHPSEEAAHVVPRRYKKVRWDPQNGIGLCRSQHAFFTEHPYEWEIWCRSVLGDDEYERLWQIARGMK